MTNLNLNDREAPLTLAEVKALLGATPIPIAREDLEVILQNTRNGARPVTVLACTTPKLNVKTAEGTPLPEGFRTGAGKSAEWHVRKRAVVNGMIQYDYEASMNRALVAEGKEPDFEAGSREWGDRREVEGKPRCCIVDHTPKGGANAGKPTSYMSLFVRRSLGYHYHLTDGTYLSPDLVHSYMSDKKPELIRVRDYTLSNIERLSIDGLVYIIIGTPAYDEWNAANVAA
jgi:hypothetical protein